MKASAFAQASRPLEIITSLGKDALFLVGFEGCEGVSQLFRFQLDLLAENRREIPFDKLLAQKVTIRLALGGGKNRYFNGMVSRFSQGMRDETFTRYEAEIVPDLWLLTRQTQSRIFQHQSVPDILKKVLERLDVRFELSGEFHPRNYCVQYRESDFAFASRLMEEEGIYYFFKHTDGGHQLVVANSPQSHPETPEASTIIFDELRGGNRPEFRITEWEKVQEIRAGKVTLWDHSFELPHSHLQADRVTVASVPVGKATHSLKLPGAERREIYDYPGAYAQRFDGINRGGGDRPEELRKIYQDNQRTAGIRMQQEALPGLRIQGASNCRQFVSGHKFMLTRHFNADGTYVVTGVQHHCGLGDQGHSGDGVVMNYQNRFTCIPLALPFRPARTTPRPHVEGIQTAVVVGPDGEEIFTDRYGRVKIQFHWDRQGQHDADSSCWVRVAQPSAGKRWGTFFWPRIGQEVVVHFLEGDPDRPIILGSVYNAEQMPPYLGQGPDPKHPHDNKLSGIKTCTTPGGEGFNELRFDDTKGKEQIFIHAQKDLEIRAENTLKINTMGNCLHLTTGYVKDGKVQGDCYIEVNKDAHERIKGESRSMTEGTESHIVKGNSYSNYQGSRRTCVGVEDVLEAPLIILKAGAICLRGEGGFITIDDAGVTIVGEMVKINSGGVPMESVAAAVGPDGKPARIETQAKEPVAPQPADQSRTGAPSVSPKANSAAPVPNASRSPGPDHF
jgi:type VI secretion system secreted protein VgrG